MKKSETTNVFTDGLVMDLNPIVTPNNVVCNALNATLITMNGNENALQNDMGNGRVETAYLPEGYVPVGTAELGGIIYVVSYNPLIDKCQIGSFPSPERNITSSEMQSPQVNVTNTQFQNVEGSENGKIINTILKVKLLSDPDSKDGLFKLNPGDKYTIYSTNNGISNNADCISDVGNPLHQIDTVPRNVTIHVVSIGEDGKIVYLDDSLKWNDASGRPPHYYIKECSGSSSVETDIDSYRTLVSSAYNVFNSKVSGELALLFELKVIDSFSVTWDAEVNTIGESESGTNDKEAIVQFNVNYTSEHSDVNLKHIILSDSEATSGLNCPVTTGNYCTIPDSDTSGRLNDGTDEDIPVTVGSFKYQSGENLADYVWNYELTPAMPFGYLDYLSVRGSINFSEIGSGKIEVDEWRYFVQDNNFYLNWGLSAYPEKNKSIQRVILTFIPFEQVNDTSVITDNAVAPSDTYPQYIITGKNSYSGYFQELINFGETSRITNGSLIPNYLYLVDICIHYGREGAWEYRHNYKWLYTTKQWNNVFVDETVVDFSKELTLDDVLTFSPEFSTRDNIAVNTNVYDSQIVFPRTFERDDQPYVVMGAQVTTVNYDDNGGFNQSTSSISSDVITRCTSYPALFEFEKQNADTYNFSIKQTSISHDEFSPTQDKASSIADAVLPKIAESDETTNQISIASDFGSTVKTVIEEGIKTKAIDDKAIDSFSSTLTQNEGHFDINVRGALFARINAELVMKQVSIQQEIRPLLYYVDDYQTLGLSSSSKFTSLFGEQHRDGGGGDPFEFRFWDINDTSGSNDHWSNKKEWNPGDDWDTSNWWNITPYNNYLNPWMLSSGGSFQCMRWDGGVNTKFDWKNVQGKYSLWAKSSEGHYIPINCFRSSESDLAKLVALLYMSLYYVNTDTTSKNLAVVNNINYMTSYSETWNIVVASYLNINNVQDSVVLVSQNGSKISLQELQNTCNAIQKDGEQVIDIHNITRTALPKLEFSDFTISHVFLIQNIDLYNLYENAKSTTLQAIALLSTEDSWIECSPKTQNKLYVYNTSTKDFVRLDQYSPRYIYTGGNITEAESDLGTDIKRLKITGGTTVSTSNPIFKAFTISDGDVQLTERDLLVVKKTMEFQTDSKNDNTSTVSNNSGYGLLDNYKV